MTNKWRIFWVASFTLVIFFQACGMHSWEELFISTADEKKMGREFDSLVRKGSRDVVQAGEEIWKPNSNNTAQQAFYNYYLAKGKEVVNAIDSKDLQAILPSENLCRNNNGDNPNEKSSCKKDNFFEFKIIKSNQLNAFAVPGGYVYFYTKILTDSRSGFKSESEFMSVMGHEIGHVVLHHSRDRMIKQAGANAVVEALLGDGVAGLIGLLGANFWLTRNGQEDESAADSMGWVYTSKVGISTKGLSEFFGRQLPTYNSSAGTCDRESEASLTDVFSTHPPSCKRVMDNKRRMGSQDLPMDRPNNPDNGGKTFTQLVNAAGF